MTLEMFIITAVKIGLVFFIVLTAAAYLSYAERRILAFIQIRLGPNRVGPFGLLQPLADGIKFIFKEDIIPYDASRFLYILAPTLALIPALMTFAVVPVGDKVNLFGREITLYVTHLNVGLLYVFALTSLGVYGIVLAGWSSNSKYSLFGGLRSTAQMISYELALGLAIVGVLMQAGSVDLVEIVRSQGQHISQNVPIQTWYVFWGQPIGFIIFFIAVMAETNRIPFDLPEAETELVAGYHTEYSSMKFAMFFVAEYANMMTASAMATILFFGGWMGPYVNELPWLGPIYFGLKVGFFLFFYIWVRGTLPRFRYDQLMDFGWKLLLPLAIINIVLTATVKMVLEYFEGGL